MKLLRRGADQLEFRLGNREMVHWIKLLSLYPRVPPAHYRLTRTDVDDSAAANQALLDEALAEQREQLRGNLRAFLGDPARCQRTASGGLLTISASDAEWLLQILNDVRVGSWLRLGAPESGLPRITVANTRDIWAMEASGFFQSCLLEALGPEA